MFKINLNNLLTKCKSCMVIASLLVIAVIVIFIIMPAVKDIRQINQDIYNQRVNLEKLYLRGQSLKESREDYETIKGEIKILDDVFYYQGEELKFITSLEKIANEKYIRQIINIQEDKSKKDEEQEEVNYETMRIELNLTGTFPNILEYLNEVQMMDSYFNIDYLKFYTSSGKPFGDSDAFKSLDKKYEKSLASQNITAILSGLTYWK